MDLDSFVLSSLRLCHVGCASLSCSAVDTSRYSVSPFLVPVSIHHSLFTPLPIACLYPSPSIHPSISCLPLSISLCLSTFLLSVSIRLPLFILALFSYLILTNFLIRLILLVPISLSFLLSITFPRKFSSRSFLQFYKMFFLLSCAEGE